jgi:uncharacterized protein (TIGR00266 family)
MEHTIIGNPDRGNVSFTLAAGESVIVEAGSMSFMTAGMTVKPRLIGGLLTAVKRKLLGGESLFLSEYSTATAGARAIAPAFPGPVRCQELRGAGDAVLLAAGSFLASGPGVTLTTEYGGGRSWFSGTGPFILRATGSGPVFFSAYGAIVERDVKGALTVDTGHLVAWEPTLDYRIRGMGSVKKTLFSGEGLVMSFTGSGRIFLQTRQLGGFVRWLAPFCQG